MAEEHAHPTSGDQPQEPGAAGSGRRRRARLPAAVVLLVVLGLLAAVGWWNFSKTGNSLAAPPGSSQASRIAAVDPDGQLFTVNADGTGRRLLSEGGRTYRFPAWSPTEPTLAVIGSDDSGAGLFIIPDRQGHELRELYFDAEHGPVYHYWSPSGEDISFIASTLEGIELRVVPVDGSAGSRLVAVGQTSFFWHWYPDGERVMIHTGFTGLPDARTKLAILPVYREQTELESKVIPEKGHFQAPAISSDGAHFAFGQMDPLGLRWLIVHETETGRTRWIQPHQGVLAMGWSPVGDQLAFISPEAEQRNYYGPLKLIDLEANEFSTLTEDIVLAFFWSPDGRKIAYLTLNDLQRQEGGLVYVYLDVWLIELDEREPHHLTTFQPSDVFVNRYLPFFDNYARSHQIWSPDSQAIVLPMLNEKLEGNITVVPVSDGAPVPVAEGLVGFWSHQ